jgi:hypothetical protein
MGFHVFRNHPKFLFSTSEPTGVAVAVGHGQRTSGRHKLVMARTELLSEDHFSVDGTLVDAWASHKSFRPRGDEGDGPQGKERDYRGEKRSNATHVSRTDPESELMRKGKGMEARLRYGVHPVVENRNPLVVAPKNGTGSDGS